MFVNRFFDKLVLIMDKRKRAGLRTWIEVDKKALKNNYQVFRSIVPKKCRLMSVVKSNAYGHGIIDFSKEISRLGIDWLGVDSVIEALALRKAGIKKPILVLGHTLPEMLKLAIENDISITVPSFEVLDALKKIKVKKPAKIHIKVDTGMGRQGFLVSDLPKILNQLKDNRQALNVEIEGLYTHFAAAKNPSFPKYTYSQLEEFKKWVNAFEEVGFNPIKHVAASSGTLIFPDTHFDLVRIGIAMYGLWPSPEVEAFCKDKLKLQPVLSWKTVVGEIKKLPKGSKIGYDLTETLTKDSLVAICPIGYWHGFPRSLSSIGWVLVGGKKCRVLGRVSMDMIAVDVSGISPNSKPLPAPKLRQAGKIRNPRIGDEVVILGRQSGEEVSADELARLADTTNYEIITRINPLIKRFYV